MRTGAEARLPFQSIWCHLEPNERMQVALAFWKESGPRAGLHNNALSFLSHQLNSREAKLRKEPAEKRASQLAQFHNVREDIARGALEAYFFALHKPMMATFLASLDIPHQECQFDADDVSKPDTPRLQKAVEALKREFPDKSVNLYTSVLLAQDADFWSGLLASDGGVSPAQTAPEAGTEQGDQPAQVRGAEEFTELDHMVTTSIINWAGGIEGSMDTAQVEHLVSELLTVNAQRHRSYFHRGYLDVLQGIKPDPHFRAENPSRRLWYLGGAVVAYARRGHHQEIAALYAREDLKQLGKEPCPRSRYSAQFVFEALCESGEAPKAAEFLSPAVVEYAGLFPMVLDWGTKLLRQGKTEEAARVLDLLEKSLPYFQDGQIPREMYHQLERRRAHCLRLKSDFGAAAAILQHLLEDPDLVAQSIVRTDLAMVRGGFRGLFALEIPADEEKAPEFCTRLRGIKPDLEEALAAHGETAHAAYCLGVLISLL